MLSHISNKITPRGWEIVKVGDFIEKPSITKNKLPNKNYQEKGKLPVIDQGSKFIGGYTDRTDMKVNCNLPVIIFGDHTKVIKYIDFDYVAGADGIKVIKPIGYYEKLFYYFLHALQLPDKGYARHFQFLEKLLIPLPPLNE